MFFSPSFTYYTSLDNGDQYKINGDKELTPAEKESVKTVIFHEVYLGQSVMIIL